MLTVTLQGQNNPSVLRCTGRIVLGTETSLLCAVIHQNKSNVILDMSEVEMIDAAGIGVLLSLQAAGIYLQLVNPPQQVQELLRITNLDSVLEIIYTDDSEVSVAELRAS